MAELPHLVFNGKRLPHACCSCKSHPLARYKSVRARARFREAVELHDVRLTCQPEL
jgi:hypothetical protein